MLYVEEIFNLGYNYMVKSNIIEEWGFMGDYNYRLDVFEGPLDLLLHLIEKH